MENVYTLYPHQILYMTHKYCCRTIGSTRSAPTVDVSQDITNHGISLNGTKVKFTFSRPYVTSDDLQIVDTQMYFLFAVGPKSGTTLSRHTARYFSPASCLSWACGERFCMNYLWYLLKYGLDIIPIKHVVRFA